MIQCSFCFTRARLLRIAAFLLVAVLASHALFGAAEDTLPEPYKSWLTRDVVYIVTAQEKQAFLQLTTNTERDQFIERFWQLRNPNPGSPTNSYKDQIYERIAYANQFFGHESGTPGWRSDMGR